VDDDAAPVAPGAAPPPPPPPPGTPAPPPTPTPAPARARDRHRWLYTAVAVFAVFELGAAAFLLDARPHDRRRPAHVAAATGHVAAPRTSDTERHDAERLRAVTALLERRSVAIRRRDRAAFEATLDPAAGTFVKRQLAVFDALKAVPLASWRYEVAPDRDVPASSPYLRKYGRAEAWSPTATLRYQLTGFDDAPTAVEQYFTFVKRGDGWRIANDADFPGVADRQTGRDVWDFGPVQVVHGARSLVLGHPGHTALLRDVAAQTDAAVPRVSAVWGGGWARRAVVVVPDTQKELASILGDKSDLSKIAAVAVAELPADAGSHPVGNRVIVNPPNFRRLGAKGRRVVLTHEVTHVATRDASANGVPTWLVEGFADYVGYQGLGLTPRTICQELAAEVRQGRRPKALPVEKEFDGGNARLAQAYEEAWLAVRMIAERSGEKALVAFYRAAGTAARDNRADPLGEALRGTLRTDPKTFTDAWRAYVAKTLG
jgi:hypothetical protein